MIHFVCICGEPFDVPAEMAGESLQCPACLRLVDVPLLGDAGSFEDDGTVRLQEAHETPAALAEKMRVFGHGEDLRLSYEEFKISGDEPANLPGKRAAPRYDPVTGELMIPMEIADDDLPPAPPAVVPGGPVLGYARSVQPAAGGTEAGREQINWWSAPWRVVSGTSLMAVSMILVLHAIVVGGFAIPGFNVFFALPALVIILTIVAHYANTMEDLGPNQKDRVPVLLRNVSMSEDVSGPLFLLFVAAFCSFGPLMVLAVVTPSKFLTRHEWVGYAGLAWGLLLFPLAAFTIVCGGVSANLRPDRMASVVGAAPLRYAMAAVTFWAATAVYLVAMANMYFPDLTALQSTAPVAKTDLLHYLSHIGVTLGVFALAIYLMHLAAFWFGLLYRDKWEQFSWVLQRHERRYSPETITRVMSGRRARSTPRQVPATTGRERLKAVGGATPAKPAGLPQPVSPIETPTRRGFDVDLRP